MESVELKTKIQKFEEFLNERLRADLEKVMIARDKVSEQLAQYLQLKNVIEQIQSNNMTFEPLKTQVDLGCNFYVQAKVSVAHLRGFDRKTESDRRMPDPSKICINIGLGYHVEYTLPEALTHIERKVKTLNKSAEKLAEDSSKIKAHIKIVLEGLREMQNISSENPQPPRSVW